MFFGNANALDATYSVQMIAEQSKTSKQNEICFLMKSITEERKHSTYVDPSVLYVQKHVLGERNSAGPNYNRAMDNVQTT